MGFDRKASLRRIKPQRSAAKLARRREEELPLVHKATVVGRELLLDTCVYIDVLQGKTPAQADRLLENRIVNHSCVALGEMTHLMGALDPADKRTASVLKTLGRTIDDIPEHRLTVPSSRVFAEAGMLAGLVTRLSGQAHSIALLNDAVLFLQAAAMGCDLLTGNRRDFDFMDQLVPGTGVILY
ncbi:hypothetical protein N5J77_23230 [Sphingobium yanoikuyae]|uniref:Type II toxin-antitoxin system VapC family toxin n=2 Tax=Sphingobium TaxID=165695 RepID=A0AA42WYB2_SPHYA|nr:MULTISPECIES: hypothetical protein [Sphingobium]MDH2134049.1 hypothetical protein [Sphingobium yanoikuyae]MDH2148657.1 hypothetical protein [Sphingobium yanoikuyae]MDH2165522.1 hypothetical protein [Sphingobium yanoikuyae]